MQADRLAIYCDLQGLELVETYREAGVSGAIPLGDRRRGKAMLAQVSDRQVKHVVALKLDRLFRDAANALTLTREWDRAGVELHLVDMGGMSLNTSSAMGRMMLTMLAGFAEWERNLIAERTRAVLWHKRAKHQAYSPTPLGFRREGKQLVEDDDEQAILQRIRAMARRGDEPERHRSRSSTRTACRPSVARRGLLRPCGTYWPTGPSTVRRHRVKPWPNDQGFTACCRGERDDGRGSYVT
jgi:DNA invertase Pin-like site-specific DNA recombinase